MDLGRVKVVALQWIAVSCATMDTTVRWKKALLVPQTHLVLTQIASFDLQQQKNAHIARKDIQRQEESVKVSDWVTCPYI